MKAGLDEFTRDIFGFTKKIISISFIDDPDVTEKMLKHFKEVLEKNGVETLDEYIELKSGFAQLTVTNITEIEIYALFPLLTDPNNCMNTILSKAVILLRSGGFKPWNRTVIPSDLTLYWAEDSQFYRAK